MLRSASGQGRVCVRWQGADLPSSQAIFGTGVAPLRDVCSALRVLDADAGAQALVEAAESQATAPSPAAIQAELSLSLLGSLGLLASLCEAGGVGCGGGAAASLLPSFELLMATVDDLSLPAAVRGACVRLLLVAYVDVPPYARALPLRPSVVWSEVASLQLPPPMPAHPELPRLHSMLLREMRALSPDAASRLGVQLPLLLPLLRLLDFLLRKGQLHTPETVEPALPHLMRVIHACALRALSPRAGSSAAASSAAFPTASQPVGGHEAVSYDGGAALHLWASALGGESRTETLSVARMACACVQAVVVQQGRLDMIAALLAVRDGVLTPPPAWIAQIGTTPGAA
jgi:hypothetical protein